MKPRTITTRKLTRPEANHWEDRLVEAVDALWDEFVDPREAYADPDGGWWLPVDGAGTAPMRGTGPITEQMLAELRTQCRAIAATNEFAINGHENRISYIVGSGHIYRAAVGKGTDGSMDLAMQVQKVIDTFVHENHWQQRQQEIVRRIDRDGEAFLRFFVDREGSTRVRFIEPDQVATPSSLVGDPSASFGIQTDPDDVESVSGFYVDGEFVDASDVQHRRANVDFNVKRGLPLYTPVRKNLRRAERLLRNMSVVAEIQSAIALIRKHRGTSRNGIEQFVANNADANVTSGATGRTRYFSQYGPGSILDAPAGMEYDFPARGLDAASFVAVLQAELRAIAARLVMPEFMFTSDASNANYASTLVAEGPAVKMFERLQAAMIEHDRAVIWRVIENAVTAGKLPHNIGELVQLQITPPSVHVRDQLQQAQVDRIAYTHGVLSPQTWSQHLGLDYDQEQKNLAVHTSARGR
ncbi:MAG TPA: phage portal protein [Lacipirellulaceae bacterium]|nr:phage portal protein [Lacipirellulaceae bacterium]